MNTKPNLFRYILVLLSLSSIETAVIIDIINMIKGMTLDELIVISIFGLVAGSLFWWFWIEEVMPEKHSIRCWLYPKEKRKQTQDKNK